jgi:hypothetical protein
MPQCPACDQPLLSCIRKHQQYLFCSHCRGEMPHFSTTSAPAMAQPMSSGGLLASRHPLPDITQSLSDRLTPDRPVVPVV